MLLDSAGGGPADPISGDPYQLEELARQLGTLTEGLEDAVVELTAIEAGAWKGPAADAFRSVVHQQPGRYAAAAGAFAVAGTAIASYAEALAAAQSAALHAQDLAEQGQIATSNWRAQAAGSGKPATGVDPGAADTALAAQMLGSSRAALAEAASGVVAALRDAESGAPSAPGLFDQIVGDVWGGITAPFKFAGNVVVGFADGTWGMAKGLYNLAQLWTAETDPLYRLVDPSGWRRATNEVDGIGTAVWNHPGEFFKDLGENLVDWNQWTSNPGQAIGELLPGVVLTIASAGSGAVADGLGEAGEAVSAEARTVDALSSVLGASGESTLNGARSLAGLNAAVEEQLPAGDLQALATLSHLTTEAGLYDSAAAQLAASDHLAAEAKVLRDSADALEQVKQPFESIHSGLEKLNYLNAGSSAANAVVGTGQQVNASGGNTGGQHLVDGAGASVPVGKGTEHVAKPSEVHVSGPDGDVHIPIGGE